MSRRQQNQQPQKSNKNTTSNMNNSREYDEKQGQNLEDDEILMAFQDLDKNYDGKITNHEFRYILTHVGDNTFTNEEVDAFFNECGLKDEDELEYEEFINYWKKNMKNN